MLIETKKFELTEVYFETKDSKLLKEKMNEYRNKGFGVSGPHTHYGEHGKECDKTYWAKATKKILVK